MTRAAYHRPNLAHMKSLTDCHELQVFIRDSECLHIYASSECLTVFEDAEINIVEMGKAQSSVCNKQWEEHCKVEKGFKQKIVDILARIDLD